MCTKEKSIFDIFGKCLSSSIKERGFQLFTHSPCEIFMKTFQQFRFDDYRQAWGTKGEIFHVSFEELLATAKSKLWDGRNGGIHF